MDESVSRKNRKRYLKGGGGGGMKKWKRNRLEPGMKGFLATSSTKDEARCIREMHAVLNEFADRMYGEKKVQGNTDDDDHEQDDDDIEATLKKERDSLLGAQSDNRNDQSTSKSNNSGVSNRFLTMDTGVANNVFIAAKAPDLDPCALVQFILNDIKETGRGHSRFIQRLIPVQITCKAYVNDIERALIANKDLLCKHFSSTTKPDPPTYAIFYKHRNNSHLSRDDVFRVVNEKISFTNPLAKVDLEKPEKAVLIDVLKMIACISIVDDYIELNKFNLHALGKKE